MGWPYGTRLEPIPEQAVSLQGYPKRQSNEDDGSTVLSSDSAYFFVDLTDIEQARESASTDSDDGLNELIAESLAERNAAKEPPESRYSWASAGLLFRAVCFVPLSLVFCCSKGCDILDGGSDNSFDRALCGCGEILPGDKCGSFCQPCTVFCGHAKVHDIGSDTSEGFSDNSHYDLYTTDSDEESLPAS